MKLKLLTRAAIIAAVYAAGTILLGSFGYGPIQVRITEALTVLPFFDPAAILGVTLGCFLANVIGGMGPWDMFGGTLITFIAAVLTNRSKNKLAAISWPILLNAFGVSAYLSVIFELPYWYNVGTIFLGQFIAIGLVGYPMMLYLEKNIHILRLDKQGPTDVYSDSAPKKGQSS